MRERLELLAADIADDLRSIDRMQSEYDAYVREVDLGNPSVYEKATIGYYLHNFYNACENIFRSIAVVEPAFRNDGAPELHDFSSDTSLCRISRLSKCLGV